MQTSKCLGICVLYLLTLATFASSAAISTTSNVYERLLNLTTIKKCSYLQTILEDTKDLLANCSYRDEMDISVSVANLHPLHCLLYSESFSQLCSEFKEEITPKELTKDHISVAQKMNITTVCNDLSNFYKVHNSSKLSTSFIESLKCKKLCTEVDDSVFRACQIAAFMVNASQVSHPVPITAHPELKVYQPSENDVRSQKDVAIQVNSPSAEAAVPPAHGTDLKVEEPPAHSSELHSPDIQNIKSGKSVEEPQVAETSPEAEQKPKQDLPVTQKNVPLVTKPEDVPETPKSKAETPAEKENSVKEQLNPSANEAKTSKAENGQNEVEQKQQLPEPPKKDEAKEPKVADVNENPNEIGNNDYGDKQEEDEDDEEEQGQRMPEPPAQRHEKPLRTNEDEDPMAAMTGDLEPKDDSYFFSYFMLFCILFVMGYVGYHNKQKLLALVLEGRRGRRQHRRRPNSANYHKLDSNLEEAVTSSCEKTTSNVIY